MFSPAPFHKEEHQPGGNVRALALKRRIAACYFLASASFLGILPFFLHHLISRLIAIATTSSANMVSKPLTLLPYVAYILLWMSAIAMGAQGRWLWQRANHAHQGATAEVAIAQLLKPLQEDGWQFKYGVPLPHPQGDVDILGRSPRGNIFAIDVKSHAGTVIFEDNRLRRVYRQQAYEFEKDFLSAAMRQALTIREQGRFRFVTPVLAFSNAELNLSQAKLRGVYGVNRATLLPMLRELA